MKLKIGDIVILKTNFYGDYGSNPVWGGKYGKITGKITHIDDFCCKVTWGNGYNNIYHPKYLTLQNIQLRLF